MIEVLAQHALDGIVVGAILALPALGLALIWRIQGFPHLAHGSLVTIGAYIAWAGMTRLGLPVPVAVVLALVVAAVFGVGMHVGVYRRLAGQPMLSLFIAAMGMDLILRYGTMLVFGTDFQRYPFPAQRGIPLGIVSITPTNLILLASGVLALGGVYALLYRTRIGKQMRAVADNQALARVSGITPEKTLIFMWVLVSVLAAISGILLGTRNVVYPYLGWDILIMAFAAAVFGGISNPFGAAVGAFVIGLVGEVGIIWFPTNYKTGLAFIVIAVVLLVRPRGIFGETVRV